MNDKAKIHLSALEMELVNNKEWIFTKQAIIEKVYLFFGELHQYYKTVVEKEKEFLPVIFQMPGGKISKGENYQGLPYIMLDYPAIFNKENIFSIRTMFWWSHFFSISLHLSGQNFIKKENISHWLAAFGEKNFYACINEKEWEHHFQSTNYISINEMNEEQLKTVCNKGFLKVAKKIDLGEWLHAPEFLEQAFREIIQVLKISSPGGEIIL